MTLLQQLGGRDAVEAVVARFYEKVLADGRLAPFFRGVSMSKLHANNVDFFTAVLGGEMSIYRGRDMSTAHAALDITDAHFDAVAGHLVDTLTELGVPEDKRAQVIALVAPLREQIVNRKTRQRAAGA